MFVLTSYSTICNDLYSTIYSDKSCLIILRMPPTLMRAAYHRNASKQVSSAIMHHPASLVINLALLFQHRFPTPFHPYPLEMPTTPSLRLTYPHLSAQHTSTHAMQWRWPRAYAVPTHQRTRTYSQNTHIHALVEATPCCRIYIFTLYATDACVIASVLLIIRCLNMFLDLDCSPFDIEHILCVVSTIAAKISELSTT